MSAASATAIKSQTRLPHCRWTTVDACRPRAAPCRSARRCGPGTWRSSRGARGRHGSAASGTSGPPARRARFHRVRVARSGRRPPRPRLRGGRGRAAGRLRPALCERSFREPRRTHGAGGRATRRGIMRHKPAGATLGGVPVLNVGEWAGPLPPPSIVCGGRAVRVALDVGGAWAAGSRRRDAQGSRFGRDSFADANGRGVGRNSDQALPLRVGRGRFHRAGAPWPFRCRSGEPMNGLVPSEAHHG